MMLNPQPSADELEKELSSAILFEDAESTGGSTAATGVARACAHLRDLARYRGPHGGRLLEIGCENGLFLREASRAGFEVVGTDVVRSACLDAARRLEGRGRIVCGDPSSLADAEERFDVCVLSNTIECVRDPLGSLASARSLLRAGGCLLIALPHAYRPSAGSVIEEPTRARPTPLFFFDDQTIQSALLRSGFHEIVVRPASATATPAESVTLVLARARPEEATPRLSIVVPAYNEAATLEPLMEALLARRPKGLDFEVILVESASTDGTRQIAQRYAADPRVKLILEEAPRGKGHAVRTGLGQARGDFILIQDADLEYDLEDYDPLLEPLIQYREAFVLGSRHGGNAWKMRRFTGQWHLSAFLNLGHWFFTGLVNNIFGQRLRDPFTMYKVFRRDCLHGLRFSCNRFDFDFELLVKLVLKGYRPLEIPVNYRSRSFKEGKKVSIWRDPLTWLKVLVRLRLERVDPLVEIERARIEGGGAR